MRKPKWIECDHDYERSGYGNDLICKKCGYAAMQATISMPLTSSSVQPATRETIEVPFYNGSEHIRITVDKENFLKELIREQGLDITHNVLQESFRKGV